MAENHRAEAVAALQQKFSGSVLAVAEFRDEVTVTVKKEDILAICTFLRDECKYNLLSDVTAVDYLGREPRFMMVYNMYSIPHKDRLRVKAPVEESPAVIDTVSGIWSTADWLEREVFDLFGITFTGHPDLRRILMTDDWEGHPLRKDYPVQGPDREPYQGRVS